jgi:hypothetical protein
MEISPSQGRYLYDCRQISMHQVEYEPMTLVFEQAKTGHASDRAASHSVTVGSKMAN